MRALTWLLVPVGFVAGVVAGLVLAWGVWQQAPVQNSPALLRRSEKERYLRLVAATYAADADFQAARTRVALLRAGHPAQWVADQAAQAERAGQPAEALQLARLAYALGATDPTTLRLAATATPESTPPPAP